MSKLGDEPAYPVCLEAPGLTKRELFAAMAMQSIVAKMPLQGANTDGSLGAIERGWSPLLTSIKGVSHGACLMADALLAELAKENDDE